MEIAFIDVFGNRKRILSEGITFVIPYSGKLIVNDVKPNTCVLNHKPYKHGTSFEYLVEQNDITLSCRSKTYTIRTLCGELSQESIIDYQDIYKQFIAYNKNGCFNYEALKKAFDVENDNAIRLCSFNKRFTHLLNSNNRSEILENVKYLPHIFYRPKLHLKQVEEVRPASIVTRIGTESIKHLASHSEHWKGIKANGLIPERLLARILEDDYAIYENVAAKTIVDRLYDFEKKEKEDVIDCKMNWSLSESYSQGGERQNFFDAINFLFKGFDKAEASTTQELEETLSIINSIIDYLSKCKSTNLYRCIKNEKEIKGKLKKTNIFMMDNYYKKVYQLWALLGKQEEVKEILEKKEIEQAYLVYCELVLLFSLKNMGFIPESENAPILKDNLFNNCSFSFADWKIVLNTKRQELFDGFITAEISQKKDIPVIFNIELPNDNSVCQDFDASKNENELIFKRKLDDNEQQKLCNLLSEHIEKNKRTKWKQNFKKILSDEMRKISFKKGTILFIPWKYGIADDYKIAKETLRQLRESIPSGFDECYILNPTRPNELTNITDEELLNTLVSYHSRNQESEKKNECGIIPVTLNDINSFRRIAKILIKNMILIKDVQNFCPQCGSHLSGDKNQGYICHTSDCKLKIYNSQCPDCKKKYWYTDYTFPKSFQIDTESLGMKILLKENDFGFKNITTLSEDHKPECPYCKSKHFSIIK